MKALHSLFVISAPSGAGKTTLVRQLLRQNSNLKLSVSTTTRSPRAGEKEGEDYFFVDVPFFQKMIKENAFIEYATVHGNFYGTSQKWVKETLKTHDVLLEIDVQGAKQIKQIFKESVLIFILPPSLQVLEERLKNRATDSEEVIEKRLNAARGEMREAQHFDYAIMNAHLADAVRALESVVLAESLRTVYQQQRHPELFLNC